MNYKPYIKHSVYRVENSGGIGNPWRQGGGKFGNTPIEFRKENRFAESGTRSFKYGGKSYDYKVTKLTKAGEARWEREKRANALKSKKNRLDDDELDKLIDPQRWMQEDRENIKSIVDDASSIAKRGSQSLEGIINKPTRGPRYDLSSMSDAELRAVLNREQMERQYNDYFNPPQLSSGQKFVKGLGTALDVASTVGGVVSLGMGIAIAANKLKKNGD